MSSRISIYNHFGQYLTEIDATLNRSWKLNEFGTATFAMSTSDDKCRKDYLQFGNFIYAEHDKLPTWAGMIDTPRQWGMGTVTVTAYSGEYILTTMITDRTATMQGVWGSIYQQLIEQTFNNDIGVLLKIGNIYGGGKSQNRTYNYAVIYEEVKRLVKESGADFELSPEIDENGRLYFNAHWYERRGMTKQFTLYEDMHFKLSSNFLREQGRIANKLRIYGEGATFNSRPVASVNNIESIGAYGQRFMAQLSQGEDIEANAEQLLAMYRHPRKTFDLAAVDIGDMFYQCRIGDIFPISCHSVGFSGSGLGTSTNIRILQMSYNEETNELKLVVDEVIQ